MSPTRLDTVQCEMALARAVLTNDRNMQHTTRNKPGLLSSHLPKRFFSGDTFIFYFATINVFFYMDVCFVTLKLKTARVVWIFYFFRIIHVKQVIKSIVWLCMACKKNCFILPTKSQTIIQYDLFILVSTTASRFTVYFLFGVSYLTNYRVNRTFCSNSAYLFNELAVFVQAICRFGDS